MSHRLAAVAGPACMHKPSDTLPIILLVIEGVLFGLFTSCMMLDQYTVVTTNVTQIDRLKGGDEAGELIWDSLSLV